MNHRRGIETVPWTLYFNLKGKSMMHTARSIKGVFVCQRRIQWIWTNRSESIDIFLIKWNNYWLYYFIVVISRRQEAAVGKLIERNIKISRLITLIGHATQMMITMHPKKRYILLRFFKAYHQSINSKLIIRTIQIK